MTELTYRASPVPIRDDLAAAHRRAWRRIAQPGTWWDGATRVAIAAETRNAPACDLCKRRKQALSPNAVSGDHDSLGVLPEAVVEVAESLGMDRDSLAEALRDPAVKDRLRAEVDKSAEAGVFGSPFIVVDGEPFWGHDRLEHAEKWLETGGW